MKGFILNTTPLWFQNLLISIYNTYLYKVRHSGVYKEKFDYYSNLTHLSCSEIQEAQDDKLAEFLTFAKEKSAWYKDINCESKLSALPILSKTDIINNLNEIKTLPEKLGVVSLTGGTTGASMKVIYTKEDVQERFAILDAFRFSNGYKLGKKVAWFSGKSLVNASDLRKGVCYRDDWFNKIRFFSTFHITKQNFDVYWSALVDFSPEYLVGFPSSVFDICSMAKERGLKFNGDIKVFFPTAETVLPIHRELIGEILGCVLVDQYASSEGAPFILECQHGSKHIHALSGIFEVVDENMEPSRSGELLVTSFTTHGTPLIRYKIGDSITLAEPGFKCQCGSSFPVVSSIDGRSTDYILSLSNGKVNLGNISNATKNISGLINFQLTQVSLDSVLVKVVTNNMFSARDELNFVRALEQRLGHEMNIDLLKVDHIPNEKSGKYRIVKNNIINK